MKKNNYLNFFKNKKILITGHTGFKGSWLSIYFASLGAKVYGVSKDIPTKPSHFNKNELKKLIYKSTYLDLINKRKISKIILSFKPDYIFHLAAQSLVGKSYEDPLLTWSSNTLGTINILESLKKIKKKETIAVLITSDKVYKNIEIKKGYKENDILGGIDPYGASKAAAEIAIESYLKSFFIKKNNKVFIGVARAGNVIGGGDWSDNRLIPDCMKSWLKNKKAVIRNPGSTRPWQHVLDVINGYVTLAYFLKKKKNKFHGEAFNFGPNSKKNYKVIEIIRNIKKYWHEIKWDTVKKRKFKENKLLNLDSNKSYKKMNWKPLLSKDDTIKLTVQWYREYGKNKKNNLKISLEQINYFKKLIKNKSLSI